MNKGGFSWKRATGITKVKRSVSRATGIPLTKSGRQRKIGKVATGGCLLNILSIIVLITIIIILSFSLISCKQTVSTTTSAPTTTQITATTQKATATTIIDNSGLSESQRKQAFYDLAELQDKISAEDPPDRGEQMLEAYSIIAKEYGITKDEMMKIVVEGMEKNWPFPPVK